MWVIFGIDLLRPVGLASASSSLFGPECRRQGLPLGEETPGSRQVALQLASPCGSTHRGRTAPGAFASPWEASS